jgi:hypothetical protein
MVVLDTYYKRRKVEPWETSGMAYRELHMRIPVGTFVKAQDKMSGTLRKVGIVEYVLVTPGKYDTWDSIDEKIFTIYFEQVTDEAELGLIALAEQGE